MPEIKMGSTFSKLDTKQNIDDSDTHADLKVRCASCAERQRVLDYRDLKSGDHITLAGQKSLFNIGDRQSAFYTHHAIVKDLETVNLSTAKATLIHFYTTSFDSKIRIRKTNEMLDLNYHEIYLIKYRHKTHPPEEIIKRAEDLLKENVKYSILNCNCEHLCSWCCMSNDTSFQVKNIKAKLLDLLSAIMSVGGKTSKLIFKIIKCIKFLILSADDVTKVASMTWVPWCILSVVTVVFFCYTLCMHWYYSRQLSKGEICASCCRRKKSEYWCRFFACLVSQVGGLGLLTLVIALGASTGVAIGVLSGLIVLTLTLICSVKKIRSIFCSPFEGKRNKVDNMDQIGVGDVISFNHWKLRHAAIVSDVTKHDATSGKLKVIHYLPKKLGKRMIVEEEREVNLEKDHIVRHDYSGYKTYSADEVVERARKRIGETKFGVRNRSCHFTHWAKVKENPVADLIRNEESNNGFMFRRSFTSADTLDSLSHLDPVNVDHSGFRKHATKTLGSMPANIRDEIRRGQIIEFKYFRLKHKAICTEIKYDDEVLSKVKLKMVHFNRDKCVVEEEFVFDLRYDDVRVHPIHPINCYRPDEVVRRARAKIGQSDYKLFSNRSCHLAKEVVMKKDKQLAIHMGDIKPGDVAIITYWGLDHYVIVTKVEPNESKEDNKGHMCIVHYALEHVFAIRTVKAEMIPVDLATDRIYIKDFRGYVTYPPDLVAARALSRVGEQRFNAISTTSAKLAFWAKVVQTPTIVSYDSSGIEGNGMGTMSALLLPEVGEPLLRSQFENEDGIKMPAKEVLLLPHVGEIDNGLQQVAAYTWDDLELGMIIEFYYYWFLHQGIITDIDKTAKCVEVIHYGAKNIFATRTIMESTLTIDMRRDTIKIYIADPKRANEKHVILQKARARLGEQKWGWKNRSWKFCRSCVLRDEQ